MAATLKISNMPVTSDTRNRVVAVPARERWYNILDSERKDFAELVCNYLHKKNAVNGVLLFESHIRFVGTLRR